MRSKPIPKEMQALGRGLLDRELAPLRKLKIIASPSTSWIRMIRETLGMTTAQLAKRAGISQPRITAIEKAEASDAITLKTLRETAEALGCQLVYALLPEQPLEITVRKRAEALADAQLRHTDHTMKLEDQGLTKAALNRERNRLVESLMAGEARRMWDAP